MSNDFGELKIAVICPWFFRGDAVGQCAYDYYRAFHELGYRNVRAIGTRNDFSDMEFERCEDLEQLKKSSYFKQADLLIYHYAIYHEYFWAIEALRKHGKHVVCFHNVTPRHLMPSHTWNIIDQSFAQIKVFSHADVIWADSRENIFELERQGISGMPVFELPLAVDRPRFSRFESKNSKKIELLCVGRFFSSKGLLDVVEAIVYVKKYVKQRFVLRLVGNTDFSDAEYVAEIRNRILELGLGEYVDFVGKVDEATLARLFQNAHIYVSASYHEGFCVPVIEALRAGAIPVTYDAGNLKWISGGYGRKIPTGNIQKLAEVLSQTIEEVVHSLDNVNALVLSLDKKMMSAKEFTENSLAYAESFSFDNFKVRLKSAVDHIFAKATG